MATDSDSKLTRHISTVTVVTADFSNSLFGGEHGYNTDLDEYHPLRHGHIHDGQHLDGHVSKVKLDTTSVGIKHVRGYLQHANLGGTNDTTPAVQVENIQCYSEAVYGIPGIDHDFAIPEYEHADPTDDTSDKCYYLDLSMAAGGDDTHVQFNEDGGFGGNEGFVYKYDSVEVGIGTDDPDYALHIFKDDNTSSICIEDQHSTSGGPDLKFRKSRSDGVVSDGDYIGNLQFYGRDDSDGNILAAGISIRVDGTPITSGVPGEIEFYTLADGETGSNSVRMKIRSDGKVGIGTAEPTTELEVSGTITVVSAANEADYGLYISKEGDGGSSLMIKLENADAVTAGVGFWGIHHLDDSVTNPSSSNSGEFLIGEAWNDPKFVIQPETGYVGINQIAPVRMLHVTDDGSGDPPVRIENLMEVSAAGDYDPVVWDSATGDLYFDSSINEDQDLFYTIKAANAGGGATDGGTFDAASTTDILTFDAGKGIEINAGTSDIVAVSLNAELDDIADVNVSAPGTGHVLTYNGSVGEWQAAVSGGAGVESLATQWVGAAEWVGASAGPHVTLTMGTAAGLGSRTVVCRALKDNTGDTMELHTMIPIPLQQSVTDMQGMMDGSHHPNITVDPPWDSVSGFPLAGPTNCRVTLFYIFDMSSGQGGVSDINFEVRLYHNSHTPGGNMFEFADGQLVTDNTSGDIWDLQHPGTGTARMNYHIYNYYATGEPSGYYYAISDFSDKAIPLDESNCGMYQFRAVLGPVVTTNGPPAGVGIVYFIGGRFQWIW